MFLKWLETTPTHSPSPTKTYKIKTFKGLNYMKLLNYFFYSIIVLVFGLTSFSFAEDTTYDNSSTFQDWKLQRYQKKINRFVSAQAFSGQLKISESQLLGNFTVHNNTRDGYTVHLQTSNKATLIPQHSVDGEVSIPYSLSFSFSGDTATQVYQQTSDIDNADFSASDAGTYDPTLGRLIMGNLGNNTCSSPTDMDVAINLNVDSITAFRMAGIYEDTITLTYADK